MAEPERLARPGGVGLVAALEGIALMLWHLVLTPFIGRTRLHWGATKAETRVRLPGDELIEEPTWTYTYAIDIDAPPTDVWKWIVQIGQGRAGFYSYQMLENFIGCRIHNVAEVIPELQHPDIGDEIRLHPQAPPLRIEILDPPDAMVLHGAPTEADEEETFVETTWQFILTDDGRGSTRLLNRGRFAYGPELGGRAFAGKFPLEPISFVMNRKMMLEIKRLAEGR